MTRSSPGIHRILVVDADPATVASYRAVLCCPTVPGDPGIDAGIAPTSDNWPPAAAPTHEPMDFVLDASAEGNTGIELARTAVARHEPYALAIVDLTADTADTMRTVERLWEADPDLEIAITAGGAARCDDAMFETIANPDRLQVLRKPLSSVELRQLVRSLARKRWAETAARNAMQALDGANRRIQLEIEARQSAEGRLLYDPLTTLPNRLLLQDRLARCIERMQHDSNFGYALVFLDLDRFKELNDALGHEAGDQLLMAVGRLLSRVIRMFDTSIRDRDLAVRLGGDEFVLLLDGVRSAEEVHIVTSRILSELDAPVAIGSDFVRIGVSMGFAMATPEHRTADDILRDADAALYHAKNQGRGLVCAFDDAIRDTVLTRRRLSKELRHAVATDGLSLLYQPLVSLDDGVMEGFEALARWTHPELGAISPSRFIPIAEEYSHIFDLGRWVLRSACRQLRFWHDEFPAHTRLAMSVNVSHRQLTDPRFMPLVRELLEEFGLQGSAIALEITESAFAKDIEQTTALLEDIRRLGVQIHLDDFGTGFSSLSMFHRLPADAIKIDRSFVANMRLDGHVANIVQAILMMAANRGLRVIAEGIETPEQLVQLQALGCPSGQGFLLSKPMPHAEIAGLIALGRRRLPNLPDECQLRKSA